MATRKKVSTGQVLRERRSGLEATGTTPREEPTAPAEIVASPDKRSHFRRVTARVRKDTYDEVQHRLEKGHRDFGDLVQTLLEAWLQGKVSA